MPLPTFPARSDRWRETTLASLLLVGWLALGGRLIQLHLTSGGELERVALRQRSFEESIPARPGDIVDRHGHVFATSITQRSVYVVPCQVQKGWEFARQLADALHLDPDRLFENIASHPKHQFLWVKRRISAAEARRVRDLQLPRETWGFREEFRRCYPQGKLAAHVIGLRDIDGVGRGGVEEQFNHRIRGKDGRRSLIRDAVGRVIEVRDRSGRPVQPGQTIRLTLDAVVQLYAERALDDVVARWHPKSTCAVVVDPKTGDVLAMASRPAFDPNEPDRIPPDAWKNRAISDIYEPGSTFKPFVVAWAIECGCLQPDEVFNCEYGAFRMGRRVLHDHHPYGDLNVTDILVKSSNIGMAKIGLRLTNDRLYQAAAAFGFGGPTGIELPGELGGMLRPLKTWNSYSTGSIPMGQEIAVTPLQTIAGYMALANGGKLISPHLLLHDSTDETLARSVVVSQPVKPSIAHWMCETPLAEVVRRGTGKKAQLPGYQVFGKSGTAQKPDPATGLYSRKLHVSSFVCGAPADDPQVLVIVSLDEPSTSGEHYGGTLAAPAAAEILKRTLEHLRIPPDKTPQVTERSPEVQATRSTNIGEGTPNRSR